MSNTLIQLLGLTAINIGLSIWAWRGRKQMIRRNAEAKAELQKIHQNLIDTIQNWEDEVAKHGPTLPPRIHHPN